MTHGCRRWKMRQEKGEFITGRYWILRMKHEFEPLKKGLHKCVVKEKKEKEKKKRAVLPWFPSRMFQNKHRVLIHSELGRLILVECSCAQQCQINVR